jgi:hypothetical protein
VKNHTSISITFFTTTYYIFYFGISNFPILYIKATVVSICSSSFQALSGQTDIHHCGVLCRKGWGRVSWGISWFGNFDLCDNYYPIDSWWTWHGRGLGSGIQWMPAWVAGASTGGGRTGGERPGGGKFDGCIMHQVHTSYYKRMMMDEVPGKESS